MPPGKLAIFDVDGTLVQSYELDGECFVAAFHDAFGIAEVDTDWVRYDHTTDPGVWKRPVVSHAVTITSF